jgi:hypothetical protein
MKTRLLLFSAWIALFFSNNAVTAQSTGPVIDSIFTGPGYVNEIYYSMLNGVQGEVNRKQWDIAFRTSRMSASILTNDAANNSLLNLAGVELYTYPKADTSGWATFDTTGLSTWKLMVNSTTDWENGAFDQNQKGHPDYGWGLYNTATHDVIGDSLYLIKLRDASFRKLWIQRKYSSLNKYEFRFANLDGTDEHSVLLDCSGSASKNFLGYSLIDNQAVDFEPVASGYWDILFTKYTYTYPDGTPYQVMGVLSNYGVKVNKFEHVATDFGGFDVAAMDSTRSPIGWEWKYFDFDNFVYHVVDSLVYFVLDRGGSIHRLVFKEFEGSSTGKIVFEKELLQPSGIIGNAALEFSMAVYPNPVASEANLLIDPKGAAKVNLLMVDLSGRQVWKQSSTVQKNELNSIEIPVSNLDEGVYLLTVSSGTYTSTCKVLVKR